MDSVAACQAWLLAHHSSPANLDEFKTILHENNLLPNKPKVITVAGTNGKGSTVACLEAILLAANYRVATFTSPHLQAITERCKLNACSAQDDKFVLAFAKVKEYYSAQSPHWFGFLLLVFLELCQQWQPDIILLEVGLGGRYCFSNCIEPDISVITSIGLDHCEILGDTHEAVAYQKAGILRQSKPAVIGTPDAPENLLSITKELDCNAMILNKNYSFKQARASWSWQSATQAYADLPIPPLVLQNAATAIAALQFLSVPEAAIRTGLQQIQLQGRCQRLQAQPEVICDVAHNPQACEYLLSQLQQLECKRSLGIVSMKGSKDIEACLAVMAPAIQHWFIFDLADDISATSFTQRASQFLHSKNAEFKLCNDVLDALEKAQAISAEDDRILIFGSFQLVGEIIKHYESSQS